MNSTNTPESIDEASQGSEEYLAIPLVKLLKRLGRVDESNKIIADLDDPNVIDIVKNDTDIMN